MFWAAVIRAGVRHDDILASNAANGTPTPTFTHTPLPTVSTTTVVSPTETPSIALANETPAIDGDGAATNQPDQTPMVVTVTVVVVQTPTPFPEATMTVPAPTATPGDVAPSVRFCRFPGHSVWTRPFTVTESTKPWDVWQLHVGHSMMSWDRFYAEVFYYNPIVRQEGHMFKVGRIYILPECM